METTTLTIDKIMEAKKLLERNPPYPHLRKEFWSDGCLNKYLEKQFSTPYHDKSIKVRVDTILGIPIRCQKIVPENEVWLIAWDKDPITDKYRSHIIGTFRINPND